MADLISRNALIAEYDRVHVGAAGGARKLMQDAPAVNRWIPVEDALPENNEIVWVCLYWEKDAFVRKGYIKNEVWYTADGYRMLITPKFWMHEYIPEPPKEDEA